MNAKKVLVKDVNLGQIAVEYKKNTPILYKLKNLQLIKKNLQII